MRSFTRWETKRRPTRWTLFVGRCGEGEHRHRLCLDRLDVRTNKVRQWILVR